MRPLIYANNSDQKFYHLICILMFSRSKIDGVSRFCLQNLAHACLRDLATNSCATQKRALKFDARKLRTWKADRKKALRRDVRRFSAFFVYGRCKLQLSSRRRAS